MPTIVTVASLPMTPKQDALHASLVSSVCIGDAVLPRSGKRYFTDSNAYKMDAFKACGNYLRKLGRMNGDVFQRRYFYVGSRHGVRIYEPYNIQTNAPETNIFQRLIWREYHNPAFISERQNFAHIVKDHHEYMALFA